MNDMDEHFSAVAGEYNEFRTTDFEPINYVLQLLSKYDRCDGVDVGCGPGRYAVLLLQRIPKLHLTCIDRNSKMVEETASLLRMADINRFKAITADAAEFPIDSNSIDVVFTFNAIHHFNLPMFLREARRVLKPHGLLLIYTRLPSQNAASIWGQYFPDFTTVERRLYSLDGLEAGIRSVPGLALDSIKLFSFDRVSSLEQLVSKARAGHYSTFRLYGEKRLEECIAAFRDNVMQAFSDTDQVRWVDGNVFLTVEAR
jgi:ubiquinone/menaquinone biosynthesis C-methylase UbiE